MRPFAHQSYPLEELAARAMSDVGSTRPMLLRVLTDMFVMRASHSGDEVRQFGELAMRVVDDAREAELLHVASALCRHPDAPADVLEQIVMRGGPAAALLLAQCPRLSTLTIDAAASLGSPESAAAVARRIDLDAATVTTLASRPEMDVLQALVRNESAPLDAQAISCLVERARTDVELGRLVLARMAHKPQASALFLQANSRQRSLILTALKRQLRETGAVSTFMEQSGSALPRRLETAALTHDREEFVGLLSQGLSSDRDLTTAILSDPDGEPLAIALRAIGVTPEVATRIFLFVDPVISHSYGKVSRLTQIVATTSLDLATALVQAMRGTPAPQRRATHAPVLDPTARPLTSRAAAERAAERAVERIRPAHGPAFRGRAQELAQRLMNRS
ncbi:MAG: hypothetical protein JWL93_1282 [Hyphomicrobiales bacterium]|nr:hypothetical protein [Hyphomicrobiales bacterium]